MLHNYSLTKKLAVKYSNDTVTANLIIAVAKTESGFKFNVVSDKGAKGLMQLKDQTFIFVSDKYSMGFGYDDVLDPEKNVMAGAKYLQYLLERFSDLDTALCAYNAGEGNVSAWLKDRRYSVDGKTIFHVPYPETEDYVKKVKKNLDFFKRINGDI